MKITIISASDSFFSLHLTYTLYVRLDLRNCLEAQGLEEGMGHEETLKALRFKMNFIYFPSAFLIVAIWVLHCYIPINYLHSVIRDHKNISFMHPSHQGSIVL